MEARDERHAHDHAPEELAAYALDALDPAAAAEVEQRLTVCPECRALAAEYAAVVNLLPLGRRETEPPAGGRERLLAEARARAEARSVRGRAPRRSPAPLALAAAAVLILVVGATLAWRVLPLRPGGDPGQPPAAVVAELRDRPGVRAVTLAGSPAAPGGSAKLLLPPDGTEAGLVVAGLPPLPADRSYQVWFARPDQTRVSGGTFGVDERGDAVALVAVPASLAEFGRVGVTEEPAGGSPTPTGTNVLGGAL